MRKQLCLLAFCAVLALPAFAQNTDIESLSGLQFNFGNPGARSLGMGGAFIGLADDASAAEANPAGLTILRKTEFSIEARNYLEQQLLTTSGTFPDVQRTAFTHYSQRVQMSFASVVVPLKHNFTIGAYFHEPLRNAGAGQVLPVRDPITGQLKSNVPNFFLPAAGGNPISSKECDQLRQTTNNPFSCLEYRVNPFVTALDVREQTYGLAGAWQVGKFSLGLTARYQKFDEGAFTFRFTQDFDVDSVSVQATAKANGADVTIKSQTDVTFAGGIKWAPNDKFSLGAVYKQGPKFNTPTFIANGATNFDFVKLADTTFHIPDVAGLGVSVRPISTLTINADAVHVKYSNLTDDFVSTSLGIRDVLGYKAPDVTELHLGGEYFFPTKVPFALRAGVWRDPAHSIEWRGPIDQFEGVAAALLFPKGESQTHLSVGAGIAWPRFQIDAAYDSSKHYKVGSLSVVTRF
jgi:long-subunit fatty acid transport protein